MLHADPLMLDIDVDHWRNLQQLLLDPARRKRRIVVLHDGGRVLKLVHTQRLPVNGAVKVVGNPHQLAEDLYRANQAATDFVAVFERNAFEDYFARCQAIWSVDDDLDDYVHRCYGLLEEYPDGMVTYPGTARHNLGLQWRLGASHDAVVGAAVRYVPPGSTVLFGIFDGEALWATLVVGFDDHLKARVVTTVDMSAIVPVKGRRSMAESLVDWVERTYPPCSLALFAGLAGAREFLAAPDKLSVLRSLRLRGELVTGPVPAALKRELALPVA